MGRHRRACIAHNSVLTIGAFLCVQENPDEVCPAGWKPGDETMKPDPKVSLHCTSEDTGS